MRYLFLIPLLFLSACSHDDRIFSCPQTGLIKDYDVIELKNKEIVVELAHIRGSCEPKAKTDAMVLEFNIPFKASHKAPSAKGDKVSVDYAISVLSPDETLLSKKIFSTSLEFDSQGLALSEEKHKIDLPVDSLQRAQLYKVVVGFVKQEGVENAK